MGVILMKVSKRNNTHEKEVIWMQLIDTTRFDLVATVVNAKTQNVDGFDYALQMALTNQATLGIIVWVDDDEISIFDALTPNYVTNLMAEASRFGTDLADIAQALGVKQVKVSVRRGSNLGAIATDVYCDEFSYDLLVFEQEHHDQNQIQHAVAVVNEKLLSSTMVL